MIIQVDDLRLLPFEAGWAIQRRIPQHVAVSNGRHHAKGDAIPERWDDVCYPHSMAHGLALLHEQSVRLSTAHAKDLKDARREWKRLTDQVIEATALAQAPQGGGVAQITSDVPLL